MITEKQKENIFFNTENLKNRRVFIDNFGSLNIITKSLIVIF